MVTRVFGVYDSKATAFLQPFFSQSNGSAIRAFEDAVRDSKTPFFAHPGDYQLYELGSFDDNSGVIVGLSPAKLLCNGADFAPPAPVASSSVQQVWPAVGSVPAAVGDNGSKQ